MFKSQKKSFIDGDLLLNSIGDGIFIVNNQGIVLKSNKAACDILGFSCAEMENQPCLKLLGAIDDKGQQINKKNAALFNSIAKGKKVSNAMRQFTRKDGEKIWASITTTPIIKNNKQIQGGIIVFRDVTLQKQREEYQTDFAHMASHDLRAPLGNVLWAAEYLVSGKLGEMKPEQKEYIDDIYSDLKEMNRIVNDLLNISRLQNKKVKPKTQKVSIEEIAKKVIADLEFYSKSQNVNIELETKSKNSLVMIDPDHLRTIIQNLTENAVRYSSPKTTIKIGAKKDGKFITFYCTNYGIGIPKEKQKFIFAKFFRAKNAVDKQGSGTGLGLYITHEMVKLNKGKIWFESEINKETTFFVQLPKA